jgi:hypothetical protein
MQGPQAAVDVIYKVLEVEKIYVSPRISNEAQQAFDKRSQVWPGK